MNLKSIFYSFSNTNNMLDGMFRAGLIVFTTLNIKLEPLGLPIHSNTSSRGVKMLIPVLYNKSYKCIFTSVFHLFSLQKEVS